MNTLQKHFTKCCIAGIVALLPLVSFVLTIIYFESQLAIYLKAEGFYFFGLGLLLAAAIVYGVGLVVTNFIGKWIWSLLDRLLDRLPILGNLYQTFKQILGYGEGPGAFFQRVVMIPAVDSVGESLGLVTNEKPFEDDPEKENLIAVFIPTAPSPASGKLVLIDRKLTRDAGISVNEAMQSIVSVGTYFGEEKPK